jgi:hypothetical protein
MNKLNKTKDSSADESFLWPTEAAGYEEVTGLYTST